MRKFLANLAVYFVVTLICAFLTVSSVIIAARAQMDFQMRVGSQGSLAGQPRIVGSLDPPRDDPKLYCLKAETLFRDPQVKALNLTYGEKEVISTFLCSTPLKPESEQAPTKAPAPNKQEAELVAPTDIPKWQPPKVELIPDKHYFGHKEADELFEWLEKGLSPTGFGNPLQEYSEDMRAHISSNSVWRAEPSLDTRALIAGGRHGMTTALPP